MLCFLLYTGKRLNLQKQLQALFLAAKETLMWKRLSSQNTFIFISVSLTERVLKRG